MKLLLLVTFLSLVSGLSTEDEGRDLGKATVLCVVTSVSLSLMVFSVYHLKPGLLAAPLQAMLFLQFVRYSLLGDFKFSSFYRQFCSQISYLFFPFEIFSEDNITDKDKLDIKINSEIFYVNAQWQLLIVLVAFLVYLFIRKRAKKSKIPFMISFCIFMYTLMDILVYACLQFNSTDLSDLKSTIGTLLGLLVALGYISCTIGSLVLLTKNPRTSSYSRVSEFKREKSITQVYYQVLSFFRLLISIFYVFSSSSSLKLVLNLIIQVLLCMYLLIIRPFFSLKDTIFSTLIHIAEGALVFILYLGDEESIENSTMNYILVFIVWGGLLLCLVKFMTNLLIDERNYIENFTSMKLREGRTINFDGKYTHGNAYTHRSELPFVDDFNNKNDLTMNRQIEPDFIID